LGRGRVLDQTSDAQRARARCASRFLVGETERGELDHVALLGEEGEQSGALVGDRGNLSGHRRGPFSGDLISSCAREPVIPWPDLVTIFVPVVRLACVLVYEYRHLYVDGAWVEPSGRGTLDVTDSTTEQRFATIPAGDADDIG